jgi:transposase
MGLRLSKTERNYLEALARAQRGQARLTRRARMILAVASGDSISAVAAKFGTSRYGVRRWIQRFEEERLDGLTDLDRSGRPIEISALERHQVVALACRDPAEFGHERVLWSHDALAETLVAEGLVRQISRRTVGMILEETELKPHRVKMWCHSKDPDYQRKMKDIVSLYTNPPSDEPVLCVDEKTGMQALSRSRQIRRAEPGEVGRFEFEYKRNGTRCLFACFNIRTGKVLGRCTRSRKRPDFFAFMDEVAASYRQRRVHVILDNLNTHRDTNQGDFVTEWSRRHGNRFVFHYTPTHGSWLNQVELWFGIVSRRVLRYGNFKSPDELVARIDSFVEQWNIHDAHPFRWTYTGEPLKA